MTAVVTQCCTQAKNPCACKVPIICIKYDYVHCQDKDKCLAQNIPQVPCQLKEITQKIPAGDWLNKNCWSQLASYAAKKHMRVTLANSAGVVLFDSNTIPILNVTEIGGTQEFVMAVSNGQGKAVRTEADGQTWFYFVRVIVNCFTGETYYLRLASIFVPPYYCPNNNNNYCGNNNQNQQIDQDY